MDTLVGPRKISQVNQVAIPVGLMRLLDLVPGDSVFFEVVSEEPPEVRLVGARTVEDRYATGRSSLDRISGQKSGASRVRAGAAGDRDYIGDADTLPRDDEGRAD